MHADKHTAAPPCGDVRSSHSFHSGICDTHSFQTQCFRGRKRGPRSLHSRFRRFKRLEHIQNSVHGSSSFGNCIDSVSTLAIAGNSSSLAMAVDFDNPDSGITNLDQSNSIVMESTPVVSCSSSSVPTVDSSLVPCSFSDVV